jgi:hypothetical protein
LQGGQDAAQPGGGLVGHGGQGRIDARAQHGVGIDDGDDAARAAVGLVDDDVAGQQQADLQFGRSSARWASGGLHAPRMT